MAELISLEQFPNVRGKTVLLRLDVNTSVDPVTKKPQGSPRLEAAASNIKLLAGKGAKVVACGHQGQAGKPDFTSLKEHAAILGRLSGIKIRFANDPKVVSPKTLDEVRSLRQGEVLLLENLRFNPDEAVVKPMAEHAKGELVKALAPLADIYVNDAFSVSHRSHASIVGFPALLPSAMGPLFEKEYGNATKAVSKTVHPVFYYLGGAKAEDYVGVMRNALEKQVVDKIYTSGIIGNLCLIARGNKLPEPTMRYLREKGYLDKLLLPIRDLIAQYNEFIETPFDFAYEENGVRKEVMLSALPAINAEIGDVGMKTARKYSNAMMKANTVFLKGPPGVYEKPAFEHGTRTMFAALANTKAFTLLGGGNSTDAFARFGIDAARVKAISLSGGALLEFMQGKELPGIAALAYASKKFGNRMN
ncbi:phosphoglycerate kinase [Candidatus Micrarchaeota archaeon]|nr:phosphoglycerate kinase [Candidatus Micrarchaeota archaeon]